MKQIQTRYIYSAIVSSILFVVCYGVLDFNFLITFLFTILFFVGGILIFKQNDIRTLDSENINKYYFLASKVANMYNGIKDEKIKEQVDKITSYTDQILISLSQRPKKVEQVFDFFDYYLDFTYKILSQYKSILKKQNVTTKEKVFTRDVHKYLSNVVLAFEKQLKNMQESKMLDMETEIKIFEKTNGIANDQIEAGEKNNEH